MLSKDLFESADVVYDPFSGSGTTMIAAMKNGRSCYGVEISPGYCDVIVKRAQTFAKQAFSLDGDGRTFDELAATREPVAA
jgi:DNA modification methylase